MPITQRITLRFDGGSRGNPGPAGIGAVLEADDATPIWSIGRFIGRATNNVAEYTGLLIGLRQARKLEVENLRVLGDSELVIKQLLGQYKVRNETLRPLWEEAMALLQSFRRTEIGHNLRGHNSLADALANLAMDRRGDVTDADLPAGGVSSSSEDLPADTSTPTTGAATRECPRCGCCIRIEREGEPPSKPRQFICRCGTPMRG